MGASGGESGKGGLGFGRKGVERGGLLVRKLVGLKIILECSLVTWNMLYLFSH